MSLNQLLDNGVTTPCLSWKKIKVYDLTACDNVTAVNGNFDNINGLPYDLGNFRAGIDPSSNPDPFIGGLLVPAGTGQFSMPITVADQSLGEANPYIYDPLSKFSFTSTAFKLKPGRYNISFNANIIAFNPLPPDPPECKIAQIIKSNLNIFEGPPECTDSKFTPCVLTTPFAGIIWSLNSSANVKVIAETEFDLKMLLNNTMDVIIPLTTNISVTELQ